jgi:hypothetical protein
MKIPILSPVIVSQQVVRFCGRGKGIFLDGARKEDGYWLGPPKIRRGKGTKGKWLGIKN